MTVQLTSDLILSANTYEGDNIFQDVFYDSDLVDIDETADAPDGVVVLVNGEKLVYDEMLREWK